MRLMLTADDQIDILCDSFEEQLLRGERPEILRFVEKAPANLAAEVFSELLSIEIEYRTGQGEAVSKAEYLAKFPEFSEAIATVGNHLADTASPAPGVIRLKEAAAFRHRFVLEERVGAGAAGEIWRARDLALSRIVAIKIPKVLARSSEERERFRREGRTAAQLRHPNIVAVHEAVQEGDVDYIVSDFIDGHNLRRRLAEEPLRLEEAVQLCAQVAAAVHYAHESGVVHRDLKPANIILDQSGQPHITDFGLAKWSGNVEDVTLSGELLGTPAYMSPEQARGESAGVDRRADVYTLGVILYEMLVGQCPFTGGYARVLDGIVHKQPEPPRRKRPDIPRDLETICLKALEKEPCARYATAAELREDLERFLSAQPIRARRAGNVSKAWLWIRRRPAAVGLGLIGPAFLFAMLPIFRPAREMNSGMAGLQRVSIDTVPSAARLKFIPLNETSGRPEPDSEAVITAESPFDGGAQPGDYLVVAALADGRFHEVIRHVPERANALPSGYNHNFWKVNADGIVVLPAIEIPGRDVTDDMIRIAPAESGPGGSPEISSIEPFYLSPKEFTWGEYKDRVNGGRWPKRAGKPLPAESDWIPADYNQALEYAEAVGKRLMTREEYAAAFNVLTELNRAQGRTESTPYQLTSQIPEWTQSRPVNYATILTADLSQQPFVADWYREVVGTRPPGSLIFRSGVKGQTLEIVAARRSQSSGIGFRCVRSERPRFLH